MMDIHGYPTLRVTLMRALIAKWGHSLAVRIPADVVRALGLSAGDAVEIETQGGQLRLIPQRPFDRQAFVADLNRLHERMQMTEPVVPQLRGDARY
jgi:antitoxin MazE